MVGVVVSAENGNVKVMNLKDLTFSSQTTENNFNPDNPYGGSLTTTRWSTSSDMYKDIEGVENFADWKMLLSLNPNTSVVDAQSLNAAFAQVDAKQYQSRYSEILTQYDSLINDSSYKGINLLRRQSCIYFAWSVTRVRFLKQKTNCRACRSCSLC